MEMTEELLKENQEKFCELLRSIERKGANIEGLISKLESSDFFEAPASAKYHNSMKGGLVDHCLNVYYNLESLVKNKHLQDLIPEESIIICGLLHDMVKMNYYERVARNVKKCYRYGKKRDELGTFDWVAELGYKVRDEEERFIYGNHEETSEFMIRQYIPLHVEESAAILVHHHSLGYDSAPISTTSKTMERYHLACLLHIADMISTYIDERV